MKPDASRRKRCLPGSVLVVMSSIPVEMCQAQAPRLTARGVDYVDAPVSGGETGARDGTLAIMAGGEADIVAALGGCVCRLGRAYPARPGRYRTMTKLANQIIVGATMVAVAEALHFADEAAAPIRPRCATR